MNRFQTRRFLGVAFLRLRRFVVLRKTCRRNFETEKLAENFTLLGDLFRFFALSSASVSVSSEFVVAVVVEGVSVTSKQLYNER